MRTQLTPILLVLAFSSGARAAPILDISHVKETTLPNGLHVVVKEEPYSNVVAAGFCVKASPLYETPEQAGLSDIVRYMMFQAPGKDEQGIAQRITDLGGSFDSYTSPDATQIRTSMSTVAFKELFPELVKAVFEPTFEEETWAKQVQELKRRITDSRRTAMGMMWSTLWEAAFNKHPYGRPVAGTPEEIALHNAQHLSEFHKALYAPNNMGLVVVGDIKAEDVFEMAEKRIGSYPSRPLKTPPPAAEPQQTETRTRLKRASTRGALVSYAWHGAGMDKKRDVCTLDVIYAILGIGENARLVRALPAKNKIGAVPMVEFITKRDPGLFVITCVSTPDAEYDTREAVLAEVEKLRAERVTEEELATAKALIYAGYAFDNTTYRDQVGSIAFYEAIDTYKFAFDYIDEMNEVTADDVQRVARELLGPSNFTLVIIRPQAAGGTFKEARFTP